MAALPTDLCPSKYSTAGPRPQQSALTPNPSPSRGRGEFDHRATSEYHRRSSNGRSIERPFDEIHCDRHGVGAIRESPAMSAMMIVVDRRFAQGCADQA